MMATRLETSSAWSGSWVESTMPKPLAREVADASQHQRLVAEIEARGRLVEHQDRRLLGERAGDQGELALAAGNAGVVVRRKVGDAEPGELLARDALVGGARAAKTA